MQFFRRLLGNESANPDQTQTQEQAPTTTSVKPDDSDNSRDANGTDTASNGVANSLGPATDADTPLPNPVADTPTTQVEDESPTLPTIPDDHNQAQKATNETINRPSETREGDTQPMIVHPNQQARDTMELDQTDQLSQPAATTPLNQLPPGVTRPLSQEIERTVAEGHLMYAQATNQGMVRTNNQDSAFSFFFSSDSVNDFPDFGLFIVADGMGGHQGGELASSITAHHVMTSIFETIYLPTLHDVDLNERVTITEALVRAVQEANAQVREQVHDGGTTITALVVLGYQAYFAHVGDSRAYLIPQNGPMEQITRDHSVVQRLIELDRITPEEAETHRQRNVLYRAVGQNDEVEVDILRRRLPHNAHIVLCSDGLWDLVPKKEIESIVRSAESLQDACNTLIKQANMRGGTDNITVIILKTPG